MQDLKRMPDSTLVLKQMQGTTLDPVSLERPWNRMDASAME